MRKPPTSDQMVVSAGEINYDNANERVSAVGNVQIYYNGSSLEADKVSYDQKNKKLFAEGNARLTDANGQVTYGQTMELGDDYRDGFVDSLRMDATDQTSISAARAERSKGNFSVFQSGTYTACEPCRDNPKKPPLWQVKAARIIHDAEEKMLYFEDGDLEFFGYPVAYFPYMSTPDPSVRRKSGFLPPVFKSSSTYGAAITIPYFWNLAPDYDVTFTPTITTSQGPLGQVEFRQRLESGSYFVRGAAIEQLNPNKFVHSDGTPTPGKRDFRGSFESSGKFSLSEKWVVGWDILAPTDRTFYQDYYPKALSTTGTGISSNVVDGLSQLYLSGRGDKSYFDIRSMYIQGFSEFDNQKQIPVIHPLLDYQYTFGRPILGGELSAKANLTSLSRDTANFDNVSALAFGDPNICGGLTADPDLIRKRATTNCVLRGFPGTYNRFSAQADWRRSITDSFGQIFTPFAYVRGDAASLSVENQPGVANYLPTGDSTVARVMPAVGLEYRYPFISVHSWGTQTLEPIAQVIVRPNATDNGKLPNEDAQSLIFDDSNLFKLDKFSGWDREEGGSRANVGVQYTAQVNKAGYFNVLFGQSYQLFGQNPFTTGDITNTGLNSGLDTATSDYVARASFAPSSVQRFTSRFRFDHDSFEIKRLEVESVTTLGSLALAALYGNYAAQPALGFLTKREGILTTATYKLTTNWNVFGGINYDLDARKIAATRLGVGYIDDCFIMGLSYATNYTISGNPNEQSHQVMLTIGLRTLGVSSVSQSVGSASSGSSPFSGL